jgi:hypothetical protein
MRSLILTTLALLTLSCGISFQRPECKKSYDNCINGCADQCEGPHREAEPDQHSSLADLDTWNGGCQTCVERCKGLGEKCEDAHRLKGD